MLRDFRDLTDADNCSLISEHGARVFVGRPTTLSADQLAEARAGDANARQEAERRRLVKAGVGWVLTVEFESAEAAARARGSFEELVDIIDELVCNMLAPEITNEPPKS